MTPQSLFDVVQIAGYIAALLFGWRVLMQVTTKVDRATEMVDSARMQLSRLTVIVEGRIDELDDHEERIRRLETR